MLDHRSFAKSFALVFGAAPAGPGGSVQAAPTGPVPETFILHPNEWVPNENYSVGSYSTRSPP